MGSRALMERLVAHDLERYSDRQMRSLQRRPRGHRLRRIEAEMAGSGELQSDEVESKVMGSESQGSRSIRCVGAAGPRGPEC